MENDNILNARQFLQEKFKEFPLPSQSYLIFMIPRTGSNLLATHLQDIGFGKPFEAFHFNHTVIQNEYGWEIDFNDPVAYMKQAITSQTVNGIFGMKLNWSQRGTFFQIAHALLGGYNSTLTDMEIFETFFPNPKFIYMKRLNKVRQAVSYSKGKQTGIWQVRKSQSEDYKEYVLPPVYNRAHIESCLEELLADNASWENYLRKNDIQFLEVWYEDLDRDFVGEMKKIYAYLNIEIPNVNAPSTKKQANAKTQNWVDRFVSDTPWLNDPKLRRSLNDGDFQTMYLQRTRMLIEAKERKAWNSIPAIRLKPLRWFFFRGKKKLQQLINSNK